MAKVFTGGSSWYDPAARLAQLSQQQRTNPGRAAGGSGTTGLLSSDGRGWNTMLDEQREFAALSRLNPSQLRGGGSFQMSDLQLPTYGTASDMPSTRTLDPATGADNSDAFLIGGRGERLPANVSGASLAGLRRAATSQKPKPAGRAPASARA